MIIVPEAEIAGLMDAEGAFEAVESICASMARQKARNFPVVREAIGHADALYGFKSGFDKESLAFVQSLKDKDGEPDLDSITMERIND